MHFLHGPLLRETPINAVRFMHRLVHAWHKGVFQNLWGSGLFSISLQPGASLWGWIPMPRICSCFTAKIAFVKVFTTIISICFHISFRFSQVCGNGCRDRSGHCFCTQNQHPYFDIYYKKQTIFPSPLPKISNIWYSSKVRNPRLCPLGFGI